MWEIVTQYVQVGLWVLEYFPRVIKNWELSLTLRFSTLPQPRLPFCPNYAPQPRGIQKDQGSWWGPILGHVGSADAWVQHLCMIAYEFGRFAAVHGTHCDARVPK